MEDHRMTALPNEFSPEQLVEKLGALMDLEQIEEDLFRGPRTDEPWTRVFGGQVVGQALMAATRTVGEDRAVHSLHSYFMRPGDPGIPIVYQVSRDRDGKSFTSRRVVAMQRGKPILNLAASFHVREEGRHHQWDMPDVPGPEGLTTDRELSWDSRERIPPARWPLVFRQRPIDMRPLHPRPVDHTPLPPLQSFWMRSVAPLLDDPRLHRVLLGYATDLMLLGTCVRPHGLHWLLGNLDEASLDHAVWFHDEFRLDDWLLYTQDSPWAGGGRGINRGLIYTRDGRLVASVVQEGLIREARPNKPMQ
jgi:acyl-CoA thioesterase-2